ncbi:FAD-dependent monooxygenase [Pelagibacterales bacterium SAG-MED31]|nr:FAD-dependent monooxygenase [Pelagibacterales bacterium SAG-MED31]
MKELYCDLHIVGGALTGLLAAYCASDLGFKIIVSERKKLNFNNKKITDDTRTTAIAEGSKAFLESQGLWKLIKNFAEPIKKIKVVDITANSNLNFYNPIPQSNLGYIVKNSKLISILISELKKKINVNFETDSNIKSISNYNKKIISLSNSKKIISKLIIAADGKNSTVRKLLRTNLFKKNYNEKAVVINFFHESPHKNTAYEFFLKTGPMAILPMQTEKRRNQSALIWSNEPGIVDLIARSGLHSQYVKEILNEKIYPYLGNVTKINSIQAFPLSAHINEKFYNDKTIYVGDAAHSIHPIAGQGWNLGLRDVKTVKELLFKFKEQDLEIGTKNFCKMYNDSCYYDAYRLYEITDKLDWVFKKDQPYFKFLKKTGFNLINKNTALKERIVQFAMGV